MIDKVALLTHIRKLLDSANARGTHQGVKVYESALKKIEEASSQAEVDDVFEKFKHALVGLEAHGHFTQDEFEIVKAIRAM